MADELWATFSIYEHRLPDVYRTSLLLFDRVVIPVPEEPLAGIKKAELEQAQADASYLAGHKLAVIFPWRKGALAEWQKKTKQQVAFDGEALAWAANHDKPATTRLILTQEAFELAASILPEGGRVTAVPATGDYKYYLRTRDTYVREGVPPRDVLRMALRHFPMPSLNTPLERLVELRGNQQFKSALKGFRAWQDGLVKKLTDNLENKEEYQEIIDKAEVELKDWIESYSRAIKEQNIKKGRRSVVLLVDIVFSTIDFAGLVKTIWDGVKSGGDDLSLRALAEPSWKSTVGKEFEPAGVIYAARKAYQTSN